MNGISQPIWQPIFKPVESGSSGPGTSQRLAGLFQSKLSTGSVVPFGTSSINYSAAAGMSRTLSVDTSVLFSGNTTTRLDVTGTGTAALVEAGTTTASVQLSDLAKNLLLKHVFVAVKSDGNNVINSVQLYVGDGTFANFRIFNCNSVADVSSDGWNIYERTLIGASSTTGTPPSYDLPQRSKLRLGLTANAVAGSFWFAAVDVVPQPKPTVVFTVDDGWAEWTWLVDQAKQRGIPISCGIAKNLIGQPSYLTESAMLDIANDPSGLYEVTNHSTNNDTYASVGLSQYVANVEECRAYLEGLGVDSYSAKTHQYVGGSYDTTLINSLRGLSYHSCRAVGSNNNSALHALISANGLTAVYSIQEVCSLADSMNLSTVISYIENSINYGTVFIVGHRFLSAAAPITWIAGYDDNYGVLNLLDYLADKKATLGWNVMRWTDWRKSMTYGVSPF